MGKGGYLPTWEEEFSSKKAALKRLRRMFGSSLCCGNPNKRSISCICWSGRSQQTNQDILMAAELNSTDLSNTRGSFSPPTFTRCPAEKVSNDEFLLLDSFVCHCLQFLELLTNDLLRLFKVFLAACADLHNTFYCLEVIILQLSPTLGARKV